MTAGQLRGSDKQPTVREHRRPIALKQTLTICTLTDRKEGIYIYRRMSQRTHRSTIIGMCSSVCECVEAKKTVGIVEGGVFFFGGGGVRIRSR